MALAMALVNVDMISEKRKQQLREAQERYNAKPENRERRRETWQKSAVKSRAKAKAYIVELLAVIAELKRELSNYRDK